MPGKIVHKTLSPKRLNTKKASGVAQVVEDCLASMMPGVQILILPKKRPWQVL
jgi:hypothetical protein